MQTPSNEPGAVTTPLLGRPAKRPHYNFKPHNGRKERIRRFKQILAGTLDVSPVERGLAMNLAFAMQEKARGDGGGE